MMEISILLLVKHVIKRIQSMRQSSSATLFSSEFSFIYPKISIFILICNFSIQFNSNFIQLRFLNFSEDEYEIWPYFHCKTKL